MTEQPVLPSKTTTFSSFTPNRNANPILAWLGKASLALFGWRPTGALPTSKRFVVIGAPHTSNWDLLLAFGYMLSIGLKINWMMKASLFFPPLGWFFKAVGGMPIDRSKRHNTVDEIIQRFNKEEAFIIGITPEGTRSRVPYWKTGFYHIAYKAQVPIVLAYFDYSRKVVGLGPAIMPSGNLEADGQLYQQFYDQVIGRHPHNFAPIQFSPESLDRFQKNQANTDGADDSETNPQ